jgi:hypothetical protein
MPRRSAFTLQVRTHAWHGGSSRFRAYWFCCVSQERSVLAFRITLRAEFRGALLPLGKKRLYDGYRFPKDGAPCTTMTVNYSS